MEGRERQIKNLMDHLQMCGGGGEREGAGGRGGPLQMEIGWKGSGQTSGERTLICSCRTFPAESRRLCQEPSDGVDGDVYMDSIKEGEQRPTRRDKSNFIG